MGRIKNELIRRVKDILNKLPYVSTLHRLNSYSKFPAGHYYSPVVSPEYISEKEDLIWASHKNEEINGLDLNPDRQLQLVKEFTSFYDQINFKEHWQDTTGYFLNNSYYGHSDGIILYCFLRFFEPKRVIEVGSGFSSALMLEVNEDFLDCSIDFIFIDPHPEARLIKLLENYQTSRKEKIIKKEVQEVDIKSFKQLEAGDILFIDSSHVVKTGSDVNYVIFKVLPELQKGVIIHFHDIYFPFEYPKSWVLNGFGWAEAYLLKAFLMYNKDFEILLFNDYLNKFHNSCFNNMPLVRDYGGSSLWLRKR